MKVVLEEEALDDLDGIHAWIARDDQTASPMGIASLTAPRRAYQIPQRCRPTYGWSGYTDGRSVQVTVGASRKRMRRGEVVMTLSHGPWLVLLSRLVAVHGNHAGRSFARNLNQAEGFRRSAPLASASPTPATSVRSVSFVGMRPARNTSPLDHPFLSKDWCLSALAGSAWAHTQ
jgi:hypothetical protein